MKTTLNLASLAVMALGQQISPHLRQTATAKVAASGTTTEVAPQPAMEKPVSKSDALQNLTIGGFSWKKDDFGMMMKATFVIYNRNKFPVKDPIVTCTHAANSGTKVDSNTRMIYEQIDAGGHHSVVQMNMGFIHSAVSSSTCRVTGFSRV